MRKTAAIFPQIIGDTLSALVYLLEVKKLKVSRIQNTSFLNCWHVEWFSKFVYRFLHLYTTVKSCRKPSNIVYSCPKIV